MIQFLVAAPCSGSGKTTLTCALLAALKRRGQDPCSFKSGPDYIDPMFHRAVLGVESHNLDLFFSAPETVRALYAQAAAGHGAAVCEGAMGFYDGQGLTTRASAWELADTLALPVLLGAGGVGVHIQLPPGCRSRRAGYSAYLDAATGRDGPAVSLRGVQRPAARDSRGHYNGYILRLQSHCGKPAAVLV